MATTTYNNVKKIKIGDNIFNLYDSGGTVTSVDITNSGGISVSGSPITTSGNISVGLLAATDSVLGGIKTGYSTNDKNYAVVLDANSNKAYVNVPWTDTQVSSAANHYAPQTATGSDKTASASGATAAWSIDVVKGITIKTDGKGHITDLSVTSGKIPANPNTDKKVQQDHSTASNNYPLLASGTVTNTTARTGTVLFNQNVYIKPSESAIYASAVKADQGVFNKLVAADATFTNATVVGLLDVQGELHTNSWTNANIANIGGSFYISPTVEATDTTTYPAKISITNNTSSWTVSITGKFATDFIKSGTATSGVTWPANSLVLITGDVVLGTTKYPLGTLKGTLGSNVTATPASTSKTITLNSVTDAQNSNSPSVLLELYQANNNANISSASFINGKISLYSLRSGSNDYRIGILLSSMGVSANSIIDIYGGVQTNPTVRIGHLADLPPFTVGGKTTVTPTGWGIYTDNGYFKGTVASTSGVIGGWTIGASSIYNGTNSKTSTTAGTYLGTDAIRNYKNTNQYVHIEDGKITAKNVELSGSITATSGTVGGWKLNTNALTADRTKQSETGSSTTISDFIILSDGNSNISREIMGQTRTDWSFAIGTSIGISADGLLYATSAYLDNGTLGFLKFSTDNLSYPNVLKITSALSAYTTPITKDGSTIFTPAYRIALSTVKTQSGASEVKINDALEYSNNYYPVGYVDNSYVYTTNINNNKLVISKESISLGRKGTTDSAIQLMTNGDILIGSTVSGDYLTYVNNTSTITSKITNLNVSAGTISQLSATQIDTNTISINGVPFSTTLEDISAHFTSVETNLGILNSNLTNNYYTKLEINDKDTALRAEINNSKQSIIEEYLMFLSFNTDSSLTASQMNLGKDIAHPIMEIRNAASEVSSTSFGISKQLFFENDDNGKKWASRFGAVISGKPNLNDVWIGG